jgi:O-antigen/teichoic acid export membrane protein
MLLLIKSLLPSVSYQYTLLLLIAAGKLAIFFSTPFKQLAAGLERFKLLARMSVISNLLRGIALAVLAVIHQMNIGSVIIVFICGDVIELLTGLYFFRRETGISIPFEWHLNVYRLLVKESLPQLGVVVITSALARFDWVFIGLFVSAVKLAEYSFAYKVFELSALPLLAIAPLLIPKFARTFKEGLIDTDKLQWLARMEMLMAAFTVLLVNTCWVPLIDPLTGGNYGTVNAYTIFILSLCLPLQYLCNFFWSIYFAKGQLKLTLHAFMLTLTVNILGDIILIPFYQNEGAAIACLAGFLAQLIFYIRKNEVKQLNSAVYDLVTATSCACVSLFGAKMLLGNHWKTVVIAIACFLMLLVISGQISWEDKKRVRNLI